MLLSEHQEKRALFVKTGGGGNGVYIKKLKKFSQVRDVIPLHCLGFPCLPRWEMRSGLLVMLVWNFPVMLSYHYVALRCVC